MKKDNIYQRIENVANYIINTNDTIRKTANQFGVSKSTIHKDVTERLIEIDPDKADKIDKILKEHKDLRALHGGMATRKMYEEKREAAALLQVVRNS